MGEVINMRLVRKAKARRAKEKKAGENRIRVGRTKAERIDAAAETAKQAALFNGAFREQMKEEDEGK